MDQKKIRKLKFLVLGSNSQLGKTISIFLKRKKIKFSVVNKNSLNLLNLKSIKGKLNKQKKCDILINCAAYTNVDGAENDKISCKKLNADSLKYISEYCNKKKILLVHFSTDYIFSKKNKPIKETETPKPINFYGLTKNYGEQNIIKSKCNFLILRISWLYSNYRKNFYLSIAELLSRKNISVVDDQFGVPTSTNFVIKNLYEILKKINLDDNIKKIINVCPDGYSSWFIFAKTIKKNISKKTFKINAIKSKYFKKIARRPSYSVLDNSLLKMLIKKKKLGDWKYHLKQVIEKS